MTIWFSTLYPPKCDGDFVSLSGWKLSQEIMDVINIPSAPQWEALKKAFQLNQGIARMTPTQPRVRVCANPKCGVKAPECTAWRIGEPDWHPLLRNCSFVSTVIDGR
jgi:hypothetical protein